MKHCRRNLYIFLIHKEPYHGALISSTFVITSGSLSLVTIVTISRLSNKYMYDKNRVIRFLSGFSWTMSEKKSKEIECRNIFTKTRIVTLGQVQKHISVFIFKSIGRLKGRQTEKQTGCDRRKDKCCESNKGCRSSKIHASSRMPNHIKSRAWKKFNESI